MIALAQTTNDFAGTCFSEVRLDSLFCRWLLDSSLIEELKGDILTTEFVSLWRLTHLVTRAQFQRNILPNGGCCAIRSRLIPLLLAKLCPRLALRNGVVDDRLLEYSLDFPCNLQD